MDIAKQYRKMAGTGLHFRGTSLLQHVVEIRELVRQTGAKTLLDYGCGAGDQYAVHHVHAEWGGILPTLFDPAFPAHNKPPKGKFDGVICTDVLEHLPVDQVDALLRTLARHAEKFLFLSVCCRPAAKHFPNGKNLHLTVEPYHWWLDKLKAAIAAEGKTDTLPARLVETP